MNAVTIYHNPACSKSRQTLELLTAHGISPTIVLYLTSPMTADQLKDLLTKLLMRPRQLLRTSEDQYKTLQLDDLNLPDSALIDAMIKVPHLIERPIVVIGDRAVIGRPPENVLTLLT